VSSQNEFGEKRGERVEPDASGQVGSDHNEPELEQALRNFRLSVHAWSDAEMSRPRTVAATIRQRSWRLAVGWALGAVLVAGGVSGAVYERHERQVALAKKIDVERQMAQQQQMAALKAREEEDQLLAKVDSDISREVPAAMEPLAQLMDVDGTK
jgi:hypothetical protein